MENAEYMKEEYNIFITILENNNRAFNEVFEYSKIDNYNNGPFYRFPMSEKLINKMKYTMNKLKKVGNKKHNISNIIKDTYYKMIDHISNLLIEYIDVVFVENNVIDIYVNDNSGFQVNLDYYIIANDMIVNKIIEKYGPKEIEPITVTQVAVIEEEPVIEDPVIEEPVTIIEEPVEQSYLSSVLQYFF